MLNATRPPVQAKKTADGWTGEVTYTDRFGNIATNLPNSVAGRVQLNNRTISHRAVTYTGIPSGELAILCGSDGCLEIGGYLISAEKLLGAKIGDQVISFTDGRDGQ